MGYSDFSNFYKKLKVEKIGTRIDRRYVWLGLVAFLLAGLIGFVSFKFQENTNAANLSGFRPGNIMSDYVMSNYKTMSESDIQNFLKSKNSCNNRNIGDAAKYPSVQYHIVDGHFVCMADEKFDGNSVGSGETAAHIIYDVSQKYKINPQVLIVLLEKEQGLITDTWPNNVQYRSATGYGCPDTAACDSKYYGLRNQLDNAARLFRTVLDGGWTNYPLGDNYVQYNPDKSCGGSTVRIENLATSALYRYTPYQPNAAALAAGTGTVHCGAYGNRNFYAFFTDWFGSTTTTYNVDSVYLENGTYQLKSLGNKSLDFNASGAAKISSNTQNFEFTRSGSYYIIKHVSTNRYLSLSDSVFTEGSIIELTDQATTCSQKWAILAVGNAYKIASSCSGFVLDISNAAINMDDAKVHLWSDNGTNAQRWKLITTTPAPITDGEYIIQTLGNKALDIQFANTSNEAKIHLYNINNHNNQTYKFTRSADGFYTIKNMTSGRVLDVAGGRNSNGVAVQIYDANNTPAQKWWINKNSDGTVTLRPACTNRVLDVVGGNISLNNTLTQIYDANNTNAQKFYIAQRQQEQVIPDGKYVIYSMVGNNNVLDIAGGAEQAKAGANLWVYSFNNTEAQKFNIKYDGSDTTYSITNQVANLAVDAASAGTTAHTNVHNYIKNNTCAQKWKIITLDNGEYSIKSACSELVLDVEGAKSTSGVNVHLYDANGTNAQRWKFKKID